MESNTKDNLDLSLPARAGDKGGVAMDNYAIADQFALLGKLMDIHGENAFKAKSYGSTAFAIEKIITPLAGLSEEQLFKTKGVGDSAGKKILELLQTGHMKAFNVHHLQYTFRCLL